MSKRNADKTNLSSRDSGTIKRRVKESADGAVAVSSSASTKEVIRATMKRVWQSVVASGGDEEQRPRKLARKPPNRKRRMTSVDDSDVEVRSWKRIRRNIQSRKRRVDGNLVFSDQEDTSACKRMRYTSPVRESPCITTTLQTASTAVAAVASTFVQAFFAFTVCSTVNLAQWLQNRRRDDDGDADAVYITNLSSNNDDDDDDDDDDENVGAIQIAARSDFGCHIESRYGLGFLHMAMQVGMVA